MRPRVVIHDREFVAEKRSVEASAPYDAARRRHARDFDVRAALQLCPMLRGLDESSRQVNATQPPFRFVGPVWETALDDRIATGASMGVAKIMVIRHAEKPITRRAEGVRARGEEDDASLITRGWQRAGALVGFFLNPTSPDVVRPEHLFAVRFDLGVEGSSRRSRQTVRPLSEMLGVKCDDRFGSLWRALHRAESLLQSRESFARPARRTKAEHRRGAGPRRVGKRSRWTEPPAQAVGRYGY